MLVERQIGDQALPPCVVVLELANAPYLVHAQMSAAFLPDVEVTSLLPSYRHTSGTAVPASAWRSA